MIRALPYIKVAGNWRYSCRVVERGGDTHAVDSVVREKLGVQIAFSPRRCSTGFTLIEVMITVAVIGILSAIAYPSYVEYVRRAKTAEATSELATMRVRLEQFYQDNRPSNYGSTAAVCGVAVPVSPSFTYTCNWGAGGTNQTFLVTATGNSSIGMAGYAFTIDNNNAQTTTAYPAASGLPANCWLKRKGDTC